MIETEKFRSYAIVGMVISLLVLCGCQGLATGPVTTTTPPPNLGIASINHIVFMAQENRSFDTYFGQLPAYWAANGYPSQQLDGMPANASNPSFDGTTTVPAFHLATECIENLSPSWDESHLDWNLHEPISPTATMDGFVYNAGKFATDESFTDTAGIRAMGYYDGSDLNYYYFMASNFATSDRWFAPALNRTPSQSHVSVCSNLARLCVSSWNRCRRQRSAHCANHLRRAANCRRELEGLLQR